MDNSHRYFATTVALITTSGRLHGRNVMAAEWTMQVSYDPMIIAVFVHRSPTYRNIIESKSFGVNIASEDQAELVNLAGGYSATELRKLSIPGTFRTYHGATINVPMIRGCALNAECKLIGKQKVGDHIMVLGRVLSAKFDDSKFPLIYTRGNYRKLSRQTIPSGRSKVRLSPNDFAHFTRLASGQFVFKAAACLAQHDGGTLMQKFGDSWIAPFVVVKKGDQYARALERYLRSKGMTAKVDRIAKLTRLNLTDGKSSLRANFVAFQCRVKRTGKHEMKWFESRPRHVLLAKQLLQNA